MRLKLVWIASLLVGIIGAGSSIAIIGLTIGSGAVLDPQYSRRAHGWLEAMIILPTVLFALMASFFVYRHTALRRKLQATLTVILGLALSLAFYIAALFVFFVYR